MKKMLAGLVLVAACTAGCTTYYKVTDPTTGKVYYTTQLDHRPNGSATLKDARSGNKVTLQNSEIEKVKKEEFESGKAAPPMAMPATRP